MAVRSLALKFHTCSVLFLSPRNLTKLLYQKLSLTKLVIILQESPRSVTVQDQTYDTVEYWHKIYENSMTQFFDILSDNGKKGFFKKNRESSLILMGGGHPNSLTFLFLIL